MDKIFDQAKDKNVAAIVIYGKGSDKKAYLDSACTIQFKTSELQDAFLKRGSEGSAATATLVSVAD